MENFISVNNLSYTFESNRILHDVNLTIDRNKIYIMVGPNGGGKTVLLKLLAGIYPPTSGKIMASIDERRYTMQEALYNHTMRAGFVFEHGGLINNMSIRENIMLPMKYFKQLPASQIDYRFDRIVAELGIDKYLDNRPAQLSMGSRKLVNIGVAIANSPHVVFYDNPTLGLDSAGAKTIKSLIKILHAEYNMTSVIATNDLYFAQEIAGKIIFVDNTVIEADTFDSIKDSKNPAIQKYFSDFNPR